MKSKYFAIEELVPKAIFTKRGEKAWELIDDRLITTLDFIKERFPRGTVTINNWKWGGDREWSGLRVPASPYYSETSQHAYGRAIDAVFSHYTAEQIRQDILKNPALYPYIRGVELGVSWLHVDTRNVDAVLSFRA